MNRGVGDGSSSGGRSLIKATLSTIKRAVVVRYVTLLAFAAGYVPLVAVYFIGQADQNQAGSKHLDDFALFGIASTSLVVCIVCCQHVGSRMTLLKAILDCHLKWLGAYDHESLPESSQSLRDHIRLATRASDRIGHEKNRRTKFIAATFLSGLTWLYVATVQLQLMTIPNLVDPYVRWCVGINLGLAVMKAWETSGILPVKLVVQEHMAWQIGTRQPINVEAHSRPK